MVVPFCASCLGSYKLYPQKEPQWSLWVGHKGGRGQHEAAQAPHRHTVGLDDSVQEPFKKPLEPLELIQVGRLRVSDG